MSSLGAGNPIAASSGNKANAAASATLTDPTSALGQHTAYLAGFNITGGGATAGAIVEATVTGVPGGPLTFAFGVPTGVTIAATRTGGFPGAPGGYRGGAHRLRGADARRRRRQREGDRWLIALMVLCCDPLAIALTASVSARKDYREGLVMGRIAIALVASMISSAACAEEIWTCTYRGFGTDKDVSLTLIPSGNKVSEETKLGNGDAFRTPMYDILDNNQFALIGVAHYVGYWRGTVHIYTTTIMIDKTFGQFMFIRGEIGDDDEQPGYRTGKCRKS